jgi:HAD superfamily hydrolase (TIGR01509 family)
MLELVICDCDGVLVDSEVMINDVFTKCLCKCGVKLTIDESLRLFTGKTLKKIYSELGEMRGAIFSAEEIACIQKAIEKKVASDVGVVPGTFSLLKFLKQSGINYCIASNGESDRLHKMLAKTGLLNLFQPKHIFCSAMVKKGKPAPDLFLYAAKSIGVRSEHCLVIEDSVSGIKAAKAAQMANIAFLGASHSKRPWYREKVSKVAPNAMMENMTNIKKFIKDTYIDAIA